MTKDVLKKFIYPVAMLSGTTIGVGMFSLPYITSQVGFLTILAYFLILGSLVILIHYLFGEVALETPDLLRLPGYAKIHLGSWAEKIAFISTILGIFGAILAYLIVGGEFLGNFLSPIFGGNNFLYTLLYFSFGAILIFLGIKAISKIEFWGLIFFFLILIVIFLKGFPQIKLANLFPSPDFHQLFLPYGPILFSLWGANLIPEIEEMLGTEKKLLRKIIPIAILIPVFVYLFFIYLILGITGDLTTESALSGLGNFLSPNLISLGLVLGILTTFTSFIALGLNLKNVFLYDLKINKNLAWAITCFLPLFLFLIGIKSFIPVISFVGGIMLGIDGVFILLMYRKIKTQGTKIRSLLIYPLVLVLLGGIVYEIIYFLR